MKDPMMRSSYRPIRNLNVYEKIIKEAMKRRILEYLKTNNIILRKTMVVDQTIQQSQPDQCMKKLVIKV